MKYIIRNIWENKLRGFLILFSLTVSTFIVFLNFVARDDIIHQYKTLYEESYHGYDLMVTHEDTEDEFFEKNKFKTNNIDVSNKLSAITTFGVVDDNDLLTLKLYGVNRKSYLKEGLFEISEEDNFSNTKDNMILISPQLAENYGYKLGDTISIQTQIGVREYEIGAIGKETGLFLGVDNENLIVMTSSEVEDITEQKNRSNVLMINLNNKSDIKNSIKTLEQDNNDFVVQTLVDQETMDSNINMISQVLLIILLLALLMNYYVISSNAKVVLLSRTPIVGTFRSLGASKIKVNLILILENLIYGLLGGVFGVVCGFYFRETILGTIVQGVSNVSLGEISAPINYLYIIYALIFAVIIQLISVIHVIYQIGNYSIKNLIFEELSSVQKVSIVFTTLGFALEGVSYVLYRINNSYNIILAIVSLVSAMAGGILILPFITKYLSLFMTKINKIIFGEAPSLGARNISTSKIVNSNIKLVVISLSMILMIFMTSSSLENLFIKAKDAFELDIQIYGMEKKESDYLKLKKVQGVKDLQFSYNYTDVLMVNGKKMNLILGGFKNETLGIKNKEGKIEDLKNGEVMIDEFYAIKNGFAIGDQLKIKSDKFNSEKINVNIVGTIDSSIFTTSRNTVVFSEEQFKKDVSDIPSNIYISTNKKLTQMKKILYKELSGENITVETFTEFIESQEQQVSGILSTVWIFLILSLFLSAIGLVNNQVIGFIQRKREYAILYSVSMSKSQLNIMIFFEIISSFLIGCISGLALSIWMSKLLGVLLSSIGIYLEFNFQWGNIFIIVGAIFIVLMLTAIIPIFKISKMNIIEEIKYE
ncbi:MAG: ABC transporter permease [Senegalia sp. (in: firmicutes)]|uniref:ABC transporter permease n=1 Tax=Senegalia sp. (in: firmicutes) TaxID=1924098 RepID=UPI003F952BA3